jgi:predicted phage-related endonuclease
VQLQHEMLVTEKEWSTLCVLIGGNSRFKVFPDVRRDDQFISAMLPKLAAFQELVDTQTEPPIDDSEATARALDRMHRGGNKNTIALPDETAAWDERLCSVKEKIKRLESRKNSNQKSIQTSHEGQHVWPAAQRRALQLEKANQNQHLQGLPVSN